MVTFSNIHLHKSHGNVSNRLKMLKTIWILKNKMEKLNDGMGLKNLKSQKSLKSLKPLQYIYFAGPWNLLQNGFLKQLHAVEKKYGISSSEIQRVCKCSWFPSEFHSGRYTYMYTYRYINFIIRICMNCIHGFIWLVNRENLRIARRIYTSTATLRLYVGRFFGIIATSTATTTRTDQIRLASSRVKNNIFNIQFRLCHSIRNEFEILNKSTRSKWCSIYATRQIATATYRMKLATDSNVAFVFRNIKK